MSRTFATLAALTALTGLTLGAPSPSSAQDEVEPVPPAIEVGAIAPDFSIPGATRHGVLAEPVTLKEYEGKTVVLSFFFRARTRG